ncbi:type II secretion system F family protein [Hazenella sp. IB182357]|uniref:Type II secretion system F family protein n=1 Tax=Polycladospora coralii TaxID=2771432 RepID=A0A926NB51_9BACL|nr:type II secretion system F family protein [Polycladospora coralii]MBD1372430.1 type II secretion system F family protein [Polycladospora coralii]
MNDAPFIALLGGMAVFCMIGALYFGLQMRSAKKETNIVLEKYIGIQSEVGWSDRLVERLDQMEWAKKLAPRLTRASINLKPAEYGALFIVVIVGMLFFLYKAIEAPLWLSFLGATSLTPFASKMLLDSRKLLYVRKVDSQLSEVCRMLSSTARAGLSIPQGLEIVVKEMPPPIKDELEIIVRELRLGKDIELALKDLLSRVYSRDLQVFVNTLVIQRRAGGDLASVLNQMAKTLEERKIINKTIDASIAQSRFSAYLLPLISILIVLMMGQMIDGFFDLFTEWFGIIILILFISLQILAFFAIKKISDIKV